MVIELGTSRGSPYTNYHLSATEIDRYKLLLPYVPCEVR